MGCVVDTFEPTKPDDTFPAAVGGTSSGTGGSKSGVGGQVAVGGMHGMLTAGVVGGGASTNVGGSGPVGGTSGNISGGASSTGGAWVGGGGPVGGALAGGSSGTGGSIPMYGGAENTGGTRPSGTTGIGGSSVPVGGQASGGGSQPGGAAGIGGAATGGSSAIDIGGSSAIVGVGGSAASAGGTPATGGVSALTGGAPPATGGAATGGAVTGGGATGGAATGGASPATGGVVSVTGGAPPATGGAPTGGASSTTYLASAISAGWKHTCALMADSSVYCWGNNCDGQLGDGTMTEECTVKTTSTKPVKVRNITGASSVAAGGFHSCAIVSGKVLCWGYGGDGQLGNGKSGDLYMSGVPVEVSASRVPCRSSRAGRSHAHYSRPRPGLAGATTELPSWVTASSRSAPSPCWSSRTRVHRRL